ncbi:MAG: hypothetical protein QXT74_02710 [Candidatus Nezhaarchaeales archaeon]
MPSGMAEVKVVGGKLVRAEVSVVGNRLVDVKITGDFFLYPEDAIFDLESSLKGLELGADYALHIEAKLGQMGAQLVGASPRDVAEAIKKAVGEALSKL